MAAGQRCRAVDGRRWNHQPDGPWCSNLRHEFAERGGALRPLCLHFGHGLRGYVDHVFVVDDACPEGTGAHVAARHDPAWVTVITQAQNQGVGGAVTSGYRRARDDGYEILVKVDGDEQMDPSYLPALIARIAEGRADYAKGNRFSDPRSLAAMPAVRRLGNAGLSFVSKVSSGYWDVMDPTNGFTAIHAAVLRWLPLDRIERRYFFESDLLFRLGCVRAVVADVPMATLVLLGASLVGLVCAPIVIIGGLLLFIPFELWQIFDAIGSSAAVNMGRA